jgi:hypothetical protein
MWLDALPAELVAASASLSAARVWVALDTGRLEEVGAALDAAETSIPPDTQLMVLRATAVQGRRRGRSGGPAAGDLRGRLRVLIADVRVGKGPPLTG